MIKEKKKNEKDLLQKFVEDFPRINQQYQITQNKTEDDFQIKKTIIQIITKFSTIEQISFEFSLIIICCLFQSGAYLKSVVNRKIKVNDIEFTKKNLIFAAEQVDNKYTFRTIARYLKQIIAKISMEYNIPGHLYSRFKIENANLIASNDLETNKKIAIFCTDFQIENPETPTVVREYLANREKNRIYKNK